MTQVALVEVNSKKTWFANFGTVGGAIGGYSAKIPLMAISGGQTAEMSLAGSTLAVIAPASGYMTISGFIRYSTLGGAPQGEVFINGISVPGTFFAATSFTTGNGNVVPTVTVKVNLGDTVGYGVGGDPSNVITGQGMLSFKLQQP